MIIFKVCMQFTKVAPPAVPRCSHKTSIFQHCERSERILYCLHALLLARFTACTLYCLHALLRALFIKCTLYCAHALLRARFIARMLYCAHALLRARFVERMLFCAHAFLRARFIACTLYWGVHQTLCLINKVLPDKISLIIIMNMDEKHQSRARERTIREYISRCIMRLESSFTYGFASITIIMLLSSASSAFFMSRSTQGF